MNDTQLVRTYIVDPLQYARYSRVADGVNKEFQFPYSPMYPASSKVYKDGTLQTVVTHYTADEELGLFTFLAAPALNLEVVITGKHTVLSDDQIEAILALYSDEDEAVKLASADCLDIIASSEALILKRIKNLDLETDGPAVADSLRKHAKTLRESARGDGSSSFDLAEWVVDTMGYNERIIKDMQREGLL